MAATESYGEKLLLRLELGHVSQLLQTPLVRQGQAHTHKWTLFLRSTNGTPLDQNLIQKVIFQLHDDFPNAKRVIRSPPYEVTETGYAGFVVPVYVTFNGCKREYFMEYNMNLSYDTSSTKKVPKVLEFRDPKPSLRQNLLKFGATVQVSSSSKPKMASKGPVSKFVALFGPTLEIQHTSPKKVPTAPSKEARSPSVAKSEGKRKQEKEDVARDSGVDLDLRLSPESSPEPTEAKVEPEKPVKKSKAEQKSDLKKDVNGASGNRAGLDASLLRNLVLAVGGDVSDMDSLVSCAAPVKSQSPIFQTGDSPEAKRNESFPASPTTDLLMSPGRSQRFSTPSSSVRSEDLGDKSARKRKKRKKSKHQEEESETESKKAKKRKKKTPDGEGEKQTASAEPIDPGRFQSLRNLQRKIMTLSESSVAQKVANIVSANTGYQVTDKWLEFDLCSLEAGAIAQLFNCFDT